jgi:DNA replication factor GINS
MEENEISYKILRQIQQLERTTPFLTKIDSNFYNKLTEYLKNLKSVIEQEEDSQKIKLFNDEIKNTEKLAFSIYEFREKKIVQAALSKVRGGKPDLKNILDIEKRLYESLIEQIILTRKKILEEKSQEKSKNDSKNQKKSEGEKNNNPVVRVIEDIPEFVGIDMKTYSLRKDDIISISKQMSEPLLKRGVVKPIK